MTRIGWRTPTDAGLEEAGKNDFIAATIILMDALSPTKSRRTETKRAF
jgi:hypothetical protein